MYTDLVGELVIPPLFHLLPLGAYKLDPILLSPTTRTATAILTHLIHTHTQVALSMRFGTVQAVATALPFLVQPVWTQLCLVLGRVVNNFLRAVGEAAVDALRTECVGIIGRGGRRQVATAGRQIVEPTVEQCGSTATWQT